MASARAFPTSSGNASDAAASRSTKTRVRQPLQSSPLSVHAVSFDDDGSDTYTHTQDTCFTRDICARVCNYVPRALDLFRCRFFWTLRVRTCTVYDGFLFIFVRANVVYAMTFYNCLFVCLFVFYFRINIQKKKKLGNGLRSVSVYVVVKSRVYVVYNLLLNYKVSRVKTQRC